VQFQYRLLLETARGGLEAVQDIENSRHFGWKFLGACRC
jgi:hypothetical protein